MPDRRFRLAALVATALTATVLAGCTGPEDRTVTIGTTIELPSLDPAAVGDPAAAEILHQLYPRLLERDPDTGEILPALAESASFTSETRYAVTLPEGLRFANGDELTASDVVFSFERQRAIPRGVATRPLLTSLASVTAADEVTVLFDLRAPDPAFPAVLASLAGAILDEEVFAADAVTDAATIVAGAGFAGPLRLAEIDGTRLAFLEADDDPAAPRGRRIMLETGIASEELVARFANGGFDAVFGDFSSREHDELLAGEHEAASWTAPTGAVRLLSFDFDTMPFGRGTEEADAEKALLVRKAVADLIDREALAAVAPQHWAAEYGYVPDGWRSPPLTTSSEPGEQGVLSGASFGDRLGGPSPERASERLAKAGIETPIELAVTFAVDPGTPDLAALYEMLERQLENGGLFDVTLTGVEGPLDRATLSEHRYPAVEHLWSPMGVGPAAYFAPLYSSETGLPMGIGDGATDTLIRRLQGSLDPVKQASIVEELEARLASRLPAIPLLAEQETLYVRGDRLSEPDAISILGRMSTAFGRL